jgi:hypothetical protein
MRQLRFVMMVLGLVLANSAAAVPETLGDPQVGFSAERVLVFDGQSFVGRMWNMPGKQRHEQPLAEINPVFILRADSGIGDIVLPSLHTVVQFALPPVLSALSRPGLLGKPVGKEAVNGVATIKYGVDKVVAEGRLNGTIWLSPDGIPMRCDGSLTGRNGKISTVHWELRHVRIGRQDAALFEIPSGYTTMPPDAAATLLGLHFARHK